MSYASCPTAVVNAPTDLVWTLLTQPAGWGDVFDVRITAVDPPCSAAAGQKITGETSPKLFSELIPLKLAFRVIEVDAERFRLVIDVRLPFGIGVHEDLRCTALDGSHCRVDYHCAFEFPSGWRGALARVLTGGGREAGPIDSLSRLKRAAELRFADYKNVDRQPAAAGDSDPPRPFDRIAQFVVRFRL